MSVEPGRLPDSILQTILTLDQGPRIQVEYVWIGGSMLDLRCKTRTLPGPVKDISEIPEWNFDGSSTGQAPGHDSEVIIKPCRIFPDPFRRGNNIIVLCDTYTPQGEPLPTNKRNPAKKIFDRALNLKPWYGFEQEYTMFESDKKTPFGWPKGGFPGPQGPYYCSVGADNAFGRPIVEAHYKACLFAGIGISGINAEVMPGQWEYQVGPVEGIGACDELFMSRYLLLRVAELFGVVISFDPKPIPGNWNGAGMHTNFSTEPMRQDGGYKVIIDAIEKLKEKHSEHIAVYGEGNERRLTGAHETAPITCFSYGVANRGASVRIPRQTEKDQKGYFEDRRPASNGCPYSIGSKIFETTCLDCSGGASECSKGADGDKKKKGGK
jgi:glutamine synthetase